ncbi:baseplate assembly protein [Clostridium chromiireducens]|uniref:Baseplate J-like protein n=1 Tax=Clostridium chromiireducens TaxID=225345 RepID=A0A1V4IW83_9CLOT|nr:baseplate J/gp47 family protein [Clostridium chromiireducens]OPJ63677.1 baseplate J-like protein [Clostridium chromiireducens]
MNLASLPDVNFAQKDITAILNEMITGYENAYFEQTGEKITLYPGDKIRIFLYSQALREFQLRQLIDFSAKQNLLKYSSGDYLDNVGAFSDTERTGISYATVPVKFNLSAPQATIKTIPKGTRVTSNGSSEIYFQTIEDINIDIGDTSVEAILQCTIGGTIGNDFIAGQLNVLSDPLPWIESVVNTDVSQGGTDKEDDESYRERIRESPEGFSVAGPSGAYEYLAKQYSQSIGDVKVYSPSPGTVDIRLLLKDGELPTSTFLKGAQAYLSDKSRRPLTDNVSVNLPEVINYDINLTYYILSYNAAAASTIQKNVSQAVQDYNLWQRSKIGRDINVDELQSRIKSAGAKRTVITSPMYTKLTDTQVAFSRNVIVTYGGLEDD